MLKSIFKAVAVSAVAAVLCVGCSDKSDDGPDDGGSPSDSTITPPDTTRPPQVNGVIGDWLLVSDEEGYGTRWMTAFSFKSAGQFALREWTGFGDFWIEDFFESDDRCQATWGTSGDKIYWGEECDGNEFDGATFTYRISGDTLKINDDDGWHLLVRVNLETFKKSLGKVYNLDLDLAGTNWYRNGNEHIYFEYYSRFEDYGYIYISGKNQDYYNWIWYTEGSRLTLVELGCDRYGSNGDYCISHSINKTVTLDYQLTNDGKLRLRPTGSSAWDEWTRELHKSKATSKIDTHAVSPIFKVFRR